MPDGAANQAAAIDINVNSGSLFYAGEYTNSSKAGAGGSLMNFRQDYGGNAKNIERISITIALCIGRFTVKQPAMADYYINYNREVRNAISC